MANKNWSKHLKKQLHKNRWLAWAIAYMIIVAVGLVGYIAVSQVDFERQVFPYKSAEAWQVYRDNRLGFSLRFPPDWGIEAQQNTIVFDSPDFQEVTVSVNKLTDEKLIRKPLSIVKEEKIILDGKPAAKITNSLGNNALETVVLLKFNNKLYVIRGSSTLDQVLSTFKFFVRKI